MVAFFKKVMEVMVLIFRQYKLSNEEESFIKKNIPLWKKNNGEIKVLIEGVIDAPTSIIEKARIAKAIEENNTYKSIVIIRAISPKSSNVAPIFKSFGICDFYCWWRGYLNPYLIIPSLIDAFTLFKNVKTGDELVIYRKNGNLIGDLLYDTLIRFIPNSYTVKELAFFRHFRLIFRAFFTFHSNELILKKYQPRYLVTSHNVYAEYGLLARQANHSGAVVFLKDMDVYKVYGQDRNINEHFLKIGKKYFQDKLLDSSCIESANVYLKSRTSGNIDQIDVKNAYLNKREYTFVDLLDLYSNVNADNKNVFIMAHAFSDAPHVGEGLLFRDYYDFLEKTLIHLNSVGNINCFVKAHPSSYMWGEKGGVEAIVELNGLNNINILPKNFNSSSIVNIADCIVTAKGTAGLEFSCFGIPAVTAGKGFYYGFGIALEPETVGDYYSALSSVANLSKLSKDVINKATVLLYLVFTNKEHSKVLPKQQILPGDNYEKLYRIKFSEVSNNLDCGETMKDEFYQRVVDDVDKVNV